MATDDFAPSTIRRVVFTVTMATDRDFQPVAHAAIAELGARVHESRLRWSPSELGSANGTFVASTGAIVQWHATSAQITDIDLEPLQDDA